MTRSGKDKPPRVNRDWKKSKKVNEPISLEDLMVKELTLSLDYRKMRELSVRVDPYNENSACVKRKIRILDHLKNL